LKLGPRGFPQICFQPGYRNYGQTPLGRTNGFVYCPEPLSRKPNYKAGKILEVSDSVGPGGLPCGAPGGPEIREMDTPTIMLYGRIDCRGRLRRIPEMGK
jgi:hypothetical protein